MSNTPNKGYNNQQIGTNAGTWGTILNQNFTTIDNNLGGTLALSVAGSSNVNLTTAQAQNLIYNFSGILTGNINVTFPQQGGFYFANNETTGSFTLTVQAAGCAGSVSVPQGQQTVIYVDAVGLVLGVLANTEFVYAAGIVTGTANALVVTQTYPPDFTLNNGTLLFFTPTADNTASATLTTPDGSTKTIQKIGPTSLVNLQPNDMVAGVPITAQYNGTVWVALNVYFAAVPAVQTASFSMTFAQWLQLQICTAPLTITVTQTTNLTYYFQSTVMAVGGAVTWTPNAADQITVGNIKLIAGTSYIQPQGTTVTVYTDANGNLYLSGPGAVITGVTAGSYTNASLTVNAAGQITAASSGATVSRQFNAITGNLPTAISGTSTTAAVTISSGLATDSTNAVVITGAGYSWAVSNGNAINGYQGGTTLPTSATIHFFVCTGASGTGTFASTSLTPTLPSGYNTSFRLAFSLNTDSGGSLIPGTAIEAEGGAMLFYLTTQLLDLNAVAPNTSARTLYTLTVPTGIKVAPIYRADLNSTAGEVLLTSPDETDVAPSAGTGGGGWSTVPGHSDWNRSGVGSVGNTYDFLTTNTSGQIGARANGGSMQLCFVTRGFKDFRRN